MLERCLSSSPLLETFVAMTSGASCDELDDEADRWARVCSTMTTTIISKGRV